MSDPMAPLSPADVRAAGLRDWAQIMGRLKARYRIGDFATGLALANRVGELAERWNHHPDIVLTYRDVVISLVSHDVDAITSRDLRLARLVEEVADEMGLSADRAGLTQLDLGLDTEHAEALGPFYAALLGSDLLHGEPVDPTGQVPTVWWQEPREDDEDALPPSSHEQRWHFDVWVDPAAAEARVAAVLDAGGAMISDARAPKYWVVEDPDGNRHCICTVEGR